MEDIEDQEVKAPEKWLWIKRHADTVAVIGTVLGIFWVLHAQIQSLDARLFQQGVRTDKLYEMFVDLLKDNLKEKAKGK